MPSPLPRLLLTGVLGVVLGFCGMAEGATGDNSAPAKDKAADIPLDPWQEAFVTFKTGDADKAVSLCETALKADPNSSRFLLLYARALAAQGKNDPAEASFKKAIVLDPNSASARRLFGDFYFRLRRFDAARPSYQEALHRGGDATELSLQLLYCAVGLNDAGEAERLAAAPLFNAFDETTPTYYFAKAAVAQMKKHPDDAKPLIQQAETLYGHDLFLQYARDYFFLFASKQ